MEVFSLFHSVSALFSHPFVDRLCQLATRPIKKFQRGSFLLLSIILLEHFMARHFILLVTAILRWHHLTAAAPPPPLLPV